MILLRNLLLFLALINVLKRLLLIAVNGVQVTQV